MPDQGSLTIKIVVDTADLQRLTEEAQKTGKQVELSLGQSLKNAGEEASSSTQKLGSSFEGLLSSIHPAAVAITAVVAAATAFGGAILGTAKLAADFGESLHNMSITSGVSVETLSSLKLAAEKANLSMADLSISFRFLNRAISDVASGVKSDASEALAKLGVSVKDAGGHVKTIEQILPDLVTKFSEVKDASTRTELAMRLFGRGGSELLVLLDDLASDGFDNVVKRAKELGVTMDTETAAKADLLNDTFHELKSSLTGIAISLGVQLIPFLQNVADETINWVRQNRELIAQDLVGVFHAIGTIASLIVDGIKAAIQAIEDLTLHIVSIGKVVGSVFTDIGGAIKSFWEIIKGPEATKALAGFFGETSEMAKQARIYYANMIGDNKSLADAVKTTDNTLTFQAKSVAEHNKSLSISFADTGEKTKQLHDSILKEIDALKLQEITITQGAEAALKYTAVQKLREGNSRADVAAWLAQAEATLHAKESLARLNATAEESAKLTSELTDRVKALREETVSLMPEGLGKQLAQLNLDLQNAIAKSQQVRLGASEQDIKAAQERILQITKQFADKEQNLMIDAIVPGAGKIVAEFEKRQRDIQVLLDKGVVDYRQAEELKVIASKQANDQILALETQFEIDRLKAHGGFVNDMKAGFLEFAESMKDDTQAVQQFWANTMSSMSQTFSNVLYDTITGKFNSLLDYIKNWGKAFLKIILDLFTAIEMKHLVLNIAGVISPQTGISGNTGADKALAGLGILSPLASMGSTSSGLLGAFSSAFPTAALNIGDFANVIAPFLPAIGAGAIGAYSLTQGNYGAGIGGIIGGAASAVMALIPGLQAFAPLAAIALPLIGSIIDSLFKSKPRVEIDVGHIQDTEHRFATIAEFMEAIQNTASDTAKKLIEMWERGGTGLRTQPIRDAILKSIDTNLVKPVQTILGSLPSDIADKLNKAFASAEVLYKGSFLTITKTGEDIAKRIQDFIQGGASAAMTFAIRGFFEIFLKTLGVEADKAANFINDQFKQFQALTSDAQRTAFAQQFLLQMKAVADAYNLVNNTVLDDLGKQINQVQALSKELGFNGVPTMQEFTAKLKDMLSNAQIDPATLASFQALHDALINTKFALVQAIGSLAQFISQLNTKIVGLGGAAVDVSGQVQTAIDAIKNTILQGGLTTDQREQALQMMSSLVDEFVAEQLAAQQKILQGQISAIQSQITAQENLKTVTQQKYQAELDALNKSLEIAQKWADLSSQIKDSLSKIITSPQAPLTGIEQINFIQSQIASAKQALTLATTPEAQQAAVSTLKDLQEQLFSLGSSALGAGSPAFQAIFEQVTKELNDLLKITDAGSKDVAAIQAEIDATTKEMNDKLAAIDSNIQNLNNQLSALQAESNQLQGQAAATAKAYYDFIRNEAMKDLQTRISQLSTIVPIDVQQLNIATQQLGVLTSIDATLKRVTGMQEGGYVKPNTTQMAILHGGTMGEYVFPGNRLPAAIGQPANMNISITVPVNVQNNQKMDKVSLKRDIENIVWNEVERGALGKKIKERVTGR